MYFIKTNSVNQVFQLQSKLFNNSFIGSGTLGLKFFP